MRFAAVDFFAGDDDFEELRQCVTIEEWTGRCTHRAGSYSKVQVHLPQFFQRRIYRRKQIDAVGKELGGNLSAPPHHFVGRDGKAKRLFVKLDGERVAHSEDVLVMFAAIGDAVFGE